MTSVSGQQKRAEVDPPGIAEQRDTVICPATERFVYEPRFTFHGFRYVEVTGLRVAPAPEDFEALAWSVDVKDSAAFACSAPKINLLRDVTIALSEAGCNILSAATQTGATGVARLRFLIAIMDASLLAPLLARVNRVPSVYDARRIMPGEGAKQLKRRV